MAGHEVDLSGGDRGPVTFVVQNDQIQGNISDYNSDSESYALTVSCNESVTPHQISGTVTASNQPGAVGQAFYGIYQMDPVAKSGQLSGFKPGSTTFPTTFSTGSGQRLFVFGSGDGGNAGAGGSTSSGGSTSTGCSTEAKVVAKSITAGFEHSCAVLNDGAVRCWGSGAYGQLGDGATNGSSVPVPVSGITNAIDVTAGMIHTCSVLSTGAVKCWGDDQYDELDDGMMINRSAPESLVGITNAIAVAAGGYQTCALLSGGTVQCWYVPVSGITNAAAVSAGCALLNDGTLQCWGGDGNSVPVSVSGITSAVSAAASRDHTCAVLSGGKVQCWGTNTAGKLGNGTTTNSSVPVSVSGITSADSVATGSGHTCTKLKDGTVQCWGANGSGQLGNGTTTDSFVPVTVTGITNAVVIAAAGGSYTCAMLGDGSVQCWGDNTFGQLGNGTNTESLVPVTVCGF